MNFKLNFHEFFLTESFNIKIAPGIKAPKIANSYGEPIQWFEPEELNLFMKNIFNKYFYGQLKNAIDRYNFELEDVRNHGECIFEFKLIPKGRGTPEIAGEEHPLYDIYKGSHTGQTIFKSPQDAVESIPDNKNLVFRGMSYEEWQYIKKNGHIMSKGSYNIGQEGLTFYGKAETAYHYSNGFAPMAYQASFKKPGIVIAIPRELVLDSKDRPGKIPGGEYAHEGPLESKNIVAAWMLVPTKTKPGSLEMVFDWRRQKDAQGNYSNEFYLSNPREGSRRSPSISTAIRKIL